MVDLESLRRKHAVTGAGVSVLENGRIRWSGHAGMADDAHPVNEKTVFQVASLSKPLFACAVVRSHLRSEISLDQDLGPAADDWGSAEETLRSLTIRNALCHATGLPNHVDRGEPLSPSAAPGARFGYSGVGYDLAQRTVEKVVGSTFETWIGRELEDLGIDARFTFVPDYKGRIAVGHDTDGQSLPHRPRMTPASASSLYSTLADYAAFLQRVLRLCREQAEEARILLSPHVSVNAELGWALGFGLAHEGRIFWQFGKNAHSRSCFACDRSTGTGILVLTNSHNGMALCEEAITSILPAAGPVFAWVPR